MLQDNDHTELYPVHPGETLQKKLDYLGISQSELARSIKVSNQHVNEICNKKKSVNLNIAVKLGLYFNTKSEGADF